MRKRKTFIFVILMSALIICIINTLNYDSNLDDWIGEYNYTAIFPKEDGTINYVVNYNIKIYKDVNKYYADIENNGWFTQTKILANVTGNRKKIKFIFKETLPSDKMYGIVERYDVGDVLLYMEKDGDVLQTAWGILRVEHPAYAEIDGDIIGIFFEKIQ